MRCFDARCLQCSLLLNSQLFLYQTFDTVFIRLLMISIVKLLNRSLNTAFIKCFILSLSNAWYCLYQMLDTAFIKCLILSLSNAWYCLYQMLDTAFIKYLILPLLNAWYWLYRMLDTASIECLIPPLTNAWYWHYQTLDTDFNVLMLIHSYIEIIFKCYALKLI